MIRALLLTLLLLNLYGCTTSRSSSQLKPALRSISIIDRNGMTETISQKDRLKQYQSTDFTKAQPYQKVLRIFQRDDDGNITSHITSYHPNGQPKQSLMVVNSRAFGPYKEWHDNGRLKLEVNVIGGEPDINTQAEESWLFDGNALVWDSEGNQIANIYYEKGLLEGDSLEFHKNGCIWKRTPYKNNQTHGIVEVFLENGDQLQLTHYIKGQRHGISKRFWPNNTFAAEESYSQDKLEFGKYFDINGNSISEINEGSGFRAVFGRTAMTELHEYQHGFPEGEVQVFGSDRKVMRIYHVKNNTKHGEEVEYYELPHIRDLPKLLISWYEGKIQGITKTWYDNGVLETNREMSNNAKNGISTAWYRDGSLMLIEEYNYDKLEKGEYFRRGDKYPISSVKDGKGTVTLFDPIGNFIQKISYQNGVPSGKA